MHDSGYVCGSVCERVCVRVRVHVCTQRFASKNFLLRGRAPRLKSSPRPYGISFRTLAAAMATLAFAVSCSCGCLVLFVFLNFVLFCLDMSLHMESKMVRPGETPRRTNNKQVREVRVLLCFKKTAPLSY